MKGIKCVRRHFSHNAGITWYFYHLYLCICIFLVSEDLNTFLLLKSPPLIRDHPQCGSHIPPLYIFFLIFIICRGMRENNLTTPSSAIHKNPLHMTNVRRWTHKAEASYLYVCKFLQVLSNDTWDPSVSYMWICCHPKLKICFQKVFTRRSLVSGKSQRPALSFLLGVTLHLREGGKHLRRISNKFASS